METGNHTGRASLYCTRESELLHGGNTTEHTDIINKTITLGASVIHVHMQMDTSRYEILAHLFYRLPSNVGGWIFFT